MGYRATQTLFSHSQDPEKTSSYEKKAELLLTPLPDLAGSGYFVH